MAITKREIKSRMGYIFLGIFSVYLVTPLEQWINENLSINPIILGVVGLGLTLWYFDF